MKIYTKTGDSGETGLFGGPRVSKDHIRIEAYGTVDELNSALGLVRYVLDFTPPSPSSGEQQVGDGAIAPDDGAIPAESQLDTWLERLQHELFDLGADLATPMDAKVEIYRMSEERVTRLENQIDKFDSVLQPLTAFILPGGSPAAAHLHAARTICRRAERRVITLSGQESINLVCVIYLNRLSDALFTAARWANNARGESDFTWSKESE